MSTNLEYREKIQWATGQLGSTRKRRQRARAEDKEIFVGRTTIKFSSAGEKMPSGHQGENERVEKSEQQQVQHFSP